MNNLENNSYDIQPMLLVNLKKVKHITKHNQHTNDVVDSDNNSVLQRAIIQGSCKSIIKHLLKKGASSNYRNSNGATSLHLACRYKRYNIAKLLLKENGELANAVDQYRWTHLHHTCELGDLKLVKIVLSYSTHLTNERNNVGDTPLHIISLSNFPDTLPIIKLLLQNKADLTAKNNCGNLPLHIACGELPAEICYYLIVQTKEKLDDINVVNDIGRTPLHCCMFNKHSSAGQIGIHLIQKHADIILKDELGNTALSLGLNQNCKIIATILSSAVTQYKNNQQNRINGSHRMLGELLTKLTSIKGEIEINCLDLSGNSLLHEACQSHDYYLAKYLIYDLEADVNQANNEGKAVLHMSVGYDNIDIASKCLTNSQCVIPLYDNNQLLQAAFQNGRENLVKEIMLWIERNIDTWKPLSCGVDILKGDFQNLHGNTLLHYSCMFKCSEVTDFILESFCSHINTKNHEGKTALHTICYGYESTKCKTEIRINDMKQNECYKVTMSLLDSGADIYSKNKAGKTALDIAFTTGNYYALAAILHHIKDKDTNFFSLFQKQRDINSKNGLGHSLFSAACGVNAPIAFFQFLLQMGADPTIEVYDGIKPMHIATKRGNIELLKLLHIHASEDFKSIKLQDWRRRNLFDLACYYLDVEIPDHVMVFDFLIQNKVPVNKEYVKDHIHMATKKGKIKLLKLLHKQCEDLHSIRLPDSRNLFNLACDNLDIEIPNHLMVFQYLIQNNVPLNNEYLKYQTVLGKAIAEKKKLSLIRFMVENGVDVNCIADGNKDPPLYVACQRYTSCIPIIINHGVNINALTNQKTTVFEDYLTNALWGSNDIHSLKKVATNITIFFSAGTRRLKCTKNDLYNSRPWFSSQEILNKFSRLSSYRDIFLELHICLKLLGIEKPKNRSGEHSYPDCLLDPLHLKLLCASVIRMNILKPNAWVAVKYLPLPKYLQNYITLNHEQYL